MITLSIPNGSNVAKAGSEGRDNNSYIPLYYS
nr:MAG TPA: hypothetical protein [Caudoviricetes sp.]